MNHILLGDCLELMKTMDDNSVDAIVTDPPYGLSFMGKKWDYDVPSQEIWEECLRVLKPGGYLLSFAGTRTYHRMAVRIEDAGFEIRDMIAWVYGSGFPKSLNIGKAVDKTGGQSLSWFIDYILKVADEKGISRKELTMLFPSKNGNPTGWLWNKQKTQGITLEQYHKIKEFLQLPFADITECEREVVGRGKAGLTAGTIANFSGGKEFDLTKGTSEWEGWGTALKPAHEPICMARKPIAEKTVAENVLKYGTGGINIEACRVNIPKDDIENYNFNNNGQSRMRREEGDKIGQFDGGWKIDKTLRETPTGRFPANFIHDGSEEVLEQFPHTVSGKVKNDKDAYDGESTTGFLRGETNQDNQYGDSGSAARFFYCAKASVKERTTDNNHPTVKPIALMEYLIKLVSKEGATVLDPFGGSGSTALACQNLNRNYIIIEREKEYVQIINSRITANLQDLSRTDKRSKEQSTVPKKQFKQIQLF